MSTQNTPKFVLLRIRRNDFPWVHRSLSSRLQTCLTLTGHWECCYSIYKTKCSFHCDFFFLTQQVSYFSTIKQSTGSQGLLISTVILKKPQISPCTFILIVGLLQGKLLGMQRQSKTPVWKDEMCLTSRPRAAEMLFPERPSADFAGVNYGPEVRWQNFLQRESNQRRTN